MKGKRDEISFKITDSQLFTLMIGVLVGVGVTSLPREVAQIAERDGWIAIIVSIILGLLYLYICICYSKLFPNMSLAESAQVVLGKPLGILVTIMYSLYTFLIAGFIVRLFLESNYVYFDLYYSLAVPMTIITVALIYIGRCGLATLSRVSEIVFVFSFLFVVLFFFPERKPELINLRPVFQNGPMPMVESIPATLLSLLGLEVILVFYPFLENKKTAFRVSAMATIVTGMLYVVVFIASVTILGLEGTQIFIWPFLEYLKLISFQVVDRIDNMFVYLWTVKVMLVAAIQYFAGTFSLAMLTKRKHHDIWVLVCWPFYFAAGYFPRDVVELFDFTEKLTKYGGIFVLTLPIFLLIIAKVRRIDYGNLKQNSDS